MKSSTKDQIEGKFHEVKGKVKEKVGRSSTILTWSLKANPKTSPAKSRRRSDRSKTSSKSRASAGISARCTGVY